MGIRGRQYSQKMTKDLSLDKLENHGSMNTSKGINSGQEQGWGKDSFNK